MNVRGSKGCRGPEGKRNQKWAWAVLAVAMGLWVCSASFAAESVAKYQVVNGSEDKAYLVNTATGFVWVLTYRTTATGREPIALPYKFIKICPGNQQDFLVEDAKDASCMPAR